MSGWPSERRACGRQRSPSGWRRVQWRSRTKTSSPDGESRADLQRLCSYLTFPGIERLDDLGRLDVIEAWIERESTNARTRALAGPLREAETPASRARLLRASAKAIDVYACDLAKTIESPPPDAGEVDGGSE